MTLHMDCLTLLRDIRKEWNLSDEEYLMCKNPIEIMLLSGGDYQNRLIIYIKRYRTDRFLVRKLLRFLKNDKLEYLMCTCPDMYNDISKEMLFRMART